MNAVRWRRGDPKPERPDSTWISVAQALTLYTRIIGAHRADITLRTA